MGTRLRTVPTLVEEVGERSKFPVRCGVPVFATVQDQVRPATIGVIKAHFEDRDSEVYGTTVGYLEDTEDRVEMSSIDTTIDELCEDYEALFEECEDEFSPGQGDAHDEPDDQGNCAEDKNLSGYGERGSSLCLSMVTLMTVQRGGLRQVHHSSSNTIKNTTPRI